MSAVYLSRLNAIILYRPGDVIPTLCNYCVCRLRREPVRAAVYGVMHSIEQAISMVLRHGPYSSSIPKTGAAFVSTENALVDADAHPAEPHMLILFFNIAEILLGVLARELL